MKNRGKQQRSGMAMAITLLLMTFIFLCLYQNFIFGEMLYTYRDVGADTSEQCLPIFLYAARIAKQALGDFYRLSFGLGRFCNGVNLQMMRPENLPYVIFGENQLHIAVLISMYFKHLVIVSVAFLFFRQLFRNDWVSSVCALLWTFCGYLVLWGQNYPFLTAMMLFTVAVYGFQLYLEGNRWQVLVVPAVAILAMTSYYHLYIAMFFFFGYGVLYLWFTGRKSVEILKKAGIFAVSVIVAVGIAGTYLLPAIGSFFDSTRMGQVEASMAGSRRIYDLYTLASFAARFFSTNLIGIGNYFVGPTNYYECAILSVSLLFVYAFVYAMQTGFWKRFLGVTAACCILLCMPMTSQLLNFAPNTQRWTFILSMAQVIGIGFSLADSWNQWGKPGFTTRIIRTVLIGDAILAGVLFAGYRYNLMIGGWYLNREVLKGIFVILLIYHVAVGMIWFIRYPILPLTVAVACELVIANYPTINQRETVPRQEWYGSMYYDGTAEAVHWIRDHDPSLYRISKTYESYSDMDALVQGYHGTAVYFSTNSAELIALENSYGYKDAGNWIRFDGGDLLTNMTLGVKYVIAENSTPVNDRFYEKMQEFDRYTVYHNRYWMGFGHLHDGRISQKALENTTSVEKLALLTQSWYSSDTAEEKQSTTFKKIVNLLPTGIRQSGEDGKGTALTWNLPDLKDQWIVSGLRIRFDVKESTYLKLFGQDIPEYEKLCALEFFPEGGNEMILDCRMAGNPRQLRLITPADSIEFQSVELVLVDADQLCESLENLRPGGLDNFVQYGNRFTGTVTNQNAEEQMLCIPLIYEKYWKGEVDGKPVECINVNGGITGIPVPVGTHEISISYHNPLTTMGNIISIVSVLGYGIFVWRYIKKGKENKKSREC